MVLRKAFSLLRRLRQSLGSAAYRAYLRAAYSGIECHPSVRFGAGVRLRAFDGGRITIGEGTIIYGPSIILAHSGQLTIGRNCHIGIGAMIVCDEAIAIGDGVQIAEHVTIRDQDHIWGADTPLAQQGFATSPIAIGSDVWLAAKVTVTRGVSIAPRAVVGANAVVTRSLDKPGVYVGAPARPAKAQSVPAPAPASSGPAA